MVVARLLRLLVGVVAVRSSDFSIYRRHYYCCCRGRGLLLLESGRLSVIFELLAHPAQSVGWEEEGRWRIGREGKEGMETAVGRCKMLEMLRKINNEGRGSQQSPDVERRGGAIEVLPYVRIDTSRIIGAEQ